jgi:hypothetical protein
LLGAELVEDLVHGVELDQVLPPDPQGPQPPQEIPVKLAIADAHVPAGVIDADITRP